MEIRPHRTINRKKTFFENGIVAHVPMAQPTSKVLMNVSKNALEDLKIKAKQHSKNF